jgi:hypothetical protein
MSDISVSAVSNLLCATLCLLCGAQCNIKIHTQSTTEITQRNTENEIELLLFFDTVSFLIRFF